jgi:type I restriction enzyme, S subunit
MSIKSVSLGDVCSIKGGYAFKSSDFINNGVPVLKIANITRNLIEFDEKSSYLDEKNLKKYSEYIVEQGDILIALSGATTGKYGIYEHDEKALLNQRVGRVRPKSKLIDSKYLYYFMSRLQEKILYKAGGAAQPNISTDEVSKMLIPLPAIELQKQISRVLDLAIGLINKRKAQIKALDQLTQSVFFEMYGEPNTNPKGWKKMKLVDIAQKDRRAIKSGPFGSQLLISEYVNNGIPVLGIDNVEKNKFVWAKPKAISEEKYKELMAFKVYSGDLLISRTGTVGRTCVVPSGFTDGVIGPNLLKVSLDPNLMLPEVLSIMFNYLPNVIDQIKGMSPGATVPVFNTTNLKNVDLLVPDIDVQNEFVKKIRKIEELKSKITVGLYELENNYNSLIQRAFNGELFTQEKLPNG